MGDGHHDVFSKPTHSTHWTNPIFSPSIVGVLAQNKKLENHLKSVATGDRDAFAKLYNASSRKLFGVILRILSRRVLAEEILQEVYITIWQQAHRFDPHRGAAITWMCTIARNRALDEARKNYADRPTDDELGDTLVDETASAPDTVGMGHTSRKLDACLDELADGHKALVKLAYLDGYSRQELAVRFEQPVGTIKTWLHRSLKQLKQCIDS